MPTRAKKSKPAASPEDFDGAFASLKTVLAKHRRKLGVQADTAKELKVVGKTPSPFKQHKGQPLFFASVRMGRAYVSFHLLPLYMHPTLTKGLSPELKKRMQGKACFNFKAPPDRGLLAELKRLTDSTLKDWGARGWI